MTSRQKGIYFIVLASFSFALMNLFVRLSGDLPSLQKSFFRNFIAMLFSFFILWKERPSMHFNSKITRHMFYRSFFGTIGIFCNFYAVDHLPLSDASMLNKMSPFFAIIFGFLILKEKITFFQFSSVVLAFFGVLFVVKPSTSLFDFLPGFTGLLGGMCAGIAYTYIRSLGNQGVSGSIIIFIFSTFSCCVTLPYLIFNYHPMTLTQISFLLLTGVAGIGGQYCITAAYCHAPAREISIFAFSEIPFSALLGLFIFQQFPDKYSLVGYSIICFVSIVVYLYNTNYFKKKIINPYKK